MTQFGQHPFTAARDPLPGPPLPMPSTGVTTAPDPPALSWDGMPDDEPAVLFRRSVVSPDGYRYISDEINHRIQIVEPAGRTRDLGGTGSRAGEFRYPRGLAVLSTGTPATTRLFVCDAWNHRIQVLDGQGAVVGGFGGHGAGPGQLDVPSDVVLVRPRFAGETPDDDDPDILMLAVADSWNCRVQIFDLTGACVGAVGGANETQGVEGDMQPATRQGWPFLRTGSHPVLTFPTRLTWRSPHLEVHCAGGVVRRVDLAYAMLPTFSTWRAACSEPALSAARAYFRGRSGGPELPAAALAQMETDLGGAMLARGDVGSAAALWAEAWPAGLDRPGMKGQLAQRCERMLPGVGRRGGADLVRTVAAQVARLRHRQALSFCRPGGAVLTVGLDETERCRISLDVSRLIFGQYSIRGVCAAPNAHFAQAVTLLREHGHALVALITRRAPRARLEPMLREWQKRPHYDGKTILVNRPEDGTTRETAVA